MRNLDELIAIYLRVKELDDMPASPEERHRSDKILKEREHNLGLTPEQLDNLYDLIDEYEKDENAYEAVLEYYERCR